VGDNFYLIFYVYKILKIKAKKELLCISITCKD